MSLTIPVACSCWKIEFALGWFQALEKVLDSSDTGLESLVTIAESVRKFKFLIAPFSLVAFLVMLIISTLYKAWSFIKACTT